MKNGAITFSQVCKVFPPKTNALQDIELDIQRGEIMVIVGPSGCGKTTLLRLVAGLEHTTSGEILISGKNANVLDPVERDVGMVFQNYALFPHLSVFDNIAYGLKVRKESQPEIRQKVERVSKKLEIQELLKRKPHQLSGGQRQRVALARLLARDPKIHLFDEPMGNLDPQFRIGMRSELAHLYAENPRTCIYVTHDQAEAMTLGHRICVLREGQVLQIGTPDEIYNQPAHRFVSEFFGTPGTQCIDGRIDHSDGTTKFISGLMNIEVKEYKLPKGSITLGLRPENWDIVPAENATLSAVTKRVENLGDHRLLEVNTANQNIFIKTSLSNICINEEIFLSPQIEQAHWFERYTGKRI
jgi:sn-glycerol 3-phosphate transport system ATP-binding protein